MNVLFDANLSPKLVKQLSGLFPGFVHLLDLPLSRDADDSEIWAYAKQNGFHIVTTDGHDYPPMFRRLDSLPKVILLESWRFPTRVALETLRRSAILIAEFEHTDQGLLILRA